MSFIFYFYFYFGMGIDCGGNGLYSLWLWWLVLIVGEESKRKREKSQWMKRETMRYRDKESKMNKLMNSISLDVKYKNWDVR